MKEVKIQIPDNCELVKDVEDFIGESNKELIGFLKEKIEKMKSDEIEF